MTVAEDCFRLFRFFRVILTVCCWDFHARGLLLLSDVRSTYYGHAFCDTTMSTCSAVLVVFITMVQCGVNYRII